MSGREKETLVKVVRAAGSSVGLGMTNFAAAGSLADPGAAGGACTHAASTIASAATILPIAPFLM